VCLEFGKSPYGTLEVDKVHDGQGMVWGAHKTSYSLRGTEGVIVYHIKDQNKCLAFMWGVPFKHSNRWCVKVYDGFIKPSIGNNTDFCLS
jgi:hypothetical protein